MLLEEPKKLSPSIELECYCCGNMKAEYRCRFALGELMVQICLCRSCMSLDTAYLAEHTIGLSYTIPPADLNS